MVDAYLSVLSPYRSTQEKISGFIKSFGGTGKIHGYIIDIDYYNHIMLNPVDGMITFYTSPEFGIIKTYNNLQALLSENNPVLLKGYLEQSKATDNTFSGLIPFQIENNSGFTSIDIKNSPYAGSIKMNQLQRLFDAKVLRDWDEYVLDSFNDQLTFGKSLLPE